jgi:hypothetical protein
MPYWRFCGGFFLADKESFLEFHDLFFDKYPDFLRQHKRLIWEVNYWAWLEHECGWSPNWYAADHNDSIINIPLEFCTKRLLDGGAVTVTYPYPPFYENENEFLSSSPSYIYYQGQHILNTRFVNYSFTPEGRYAIRDPNKILHTKNIRCYLDDHSFQPICYGLMLDETVELPSVDRFSHGLEDMRLFEHNGQLHFIASNVNYSPSGKIRMIMGEYDHQHLSYKNCHILQPPNDTWCEKNWVPIQIENTDDVHFIYSWSPFCIGRLDSDHKLYIILEHPINSPHFNKVRGSSIFVREAYNWIGVVHFSEEGCPRKYYHMLVCLDPVTMTPTACSDPFCFQHYGVEFCIGFTIKDHQYVFWVSKKDNDATMISVDRSTISLTKI